MNTKHTPGPWVVVGSHVERHDGDGIYSRIAACYETTICEEHGGTALANARLIAAAPDLLAALRALVHPMASDEDVDHARAAIAKAEGNQ